MDENEDKVEKVVTLEAPVARVWRALTDHEEFGQWFRVALDGPFAEGALSTGRMTYPGYEGYPWRAVIERIEPERLFAMRWYADEDASGADVAEQPTTRVEFRLESVSEGTRVTITESGFSALGDARGLEVMRRNARGWEIQAGNLAAHVA